MALDNLNIAISSFVQEGYLLRNRDTDTLRHSTNGQGKCLKQLEQQLLEYCQLMPFNQYYEAVEQQNVQWNEIKSKL